MLSKNQVIKGVGISFSWVPSCFSKSPPENQRRGGNWLLNNEFLQVKMVVFGEVVGSNHILMILMFF